MPKFEMIKYEVEEGVLWITLNRPEVRNALCRQLWHEIMEALQKGEKDPEIRVAVLTGADPSFSAGLDIKEMSSTGFKGLGDFLGILLDPQEVLMRFPKPIIAAINGHAYAGGLELTLYCDYALCSDKAVMGFWENRRGLASGVAFLVLPEMIGLRNAKELLLTGKIYDAQDALRLGLVQKVVPHEKLHEATMEIAREMKKVAPLSHKWTKKWFFQGPPKYSTGQLWEPFQELFHSEDVIEGFTAFMEGNREPKWKGK